MIMYNADFIKKNKVFIFLKCDPSTILIRNGKKTRLYFTSKNILMV